jgi:hypothetical protein
MSALDEKERERLRAYLRQEITAIERDVKWTRARIEEKRQELKSLDEALLTNLNTGLSLIEERVEAIKKMLTKLGVVPSWRGPLHPKIYDYKSIVRNLLGEGIQPVYTNRFFNYVYAEFTVSNPAKVKEVVEKLMRSGVLVLRRDEGDVGMVEVRLKYVEPPSKIIDPIKAVKRLILPYSFNLLNIPTYDEYHESRFIEKAKEVEKDGKVWMVYAHWFYGPLEIARVPIEDAVSRWKEGWKLLKSEEEARQLAKEWKLEVKGV